MLVCSIVCGCSGGVQMCSSRDVARCEMETTVCRTGATTQRLAAVGNDNPMHAAGPLSHMWSQDGADAYACRVCTVMATSHEQI